MDLLAWALSERRILRLRTPPPSVPPPDRPCNPVGLAFSENSSYWGLGPGAFQGIDLAAAFAPVARFSQTVLHTSKHAELMTLACKSALVERDVAHLIFPDDVQTLPASPSAKASGPGGRVAVSTIAPPEDVLRSAVALVEQSTRPIVIVGYGSRDAMTDVIALALEQAE